MLSENNQAQQKPLMQKVTNSVRDFFYFFHERVHVHIPDYLCRSCQGGHQAWHGSETWIAKPHVETTSFHIDKSCSYILS